MKKLFAFLITVLLTAPAFAWQQRTPLPVAQCQVHAPYGFPQTNKKLTPICRQAYFVGYDALAKIPNYVTYTLTPPNALGCWPRTNAFVADASVKNGPRPDDYVGTGYDKGHMAPDGDQTWSEITSYESFLMTNMTPQAGSLNRGAWKLLETVIRGWAVQNNQSYTVYVGAVYGPGDRVIGKGVVVPNALYKIAINNSTQQVAGWLFPHVAPYPNLGTDLTKFRQPVNGIETLAGVAFSFPANAVEIQPGQEPAVDFGALTDTKRKLCKK